MQRPFISSMTWPKGNHTSLTNNGVGIRQVAVIVEAIRPISIES